MTVGARVCHCLYDFSEACLACFVMPDDSVNEQSEMPLIKQTSSVMHLPHSRGVNSRIVVTQLHENCHIGNIQH